MQEPNLEETYIHTLINLEGPALILFGLSVDHFTTKMHALVTEFAKKYNLISYTVSSNSSPVLNETYKIIAIPTLLVFYKGEVIIRKTGFWETPELECRSMLYILRTLYGINIQEHQSVIAVTEGVACD